MAVSKMLSVSALLIAFSAAPAFAAPPLATDDTGTQGSGKLELEVASEISWNESHGSKTTAGEVAVTVAAGIGDSIDLAVGLPWQRSWEKEGGESEKVSGISDLTVELKWRLLEVGSFSLAVKPAVSFPTGDARKGLGNGRVSYGATLIATQELKPLTIHGNLGYGHNEFSIRDVRRDSYKDVYSASMAGALEVAPRVQLVAEAGGETPSERESGAYPAFVGGGVVLSVTEWWDVAVGARFGLGPAADDAGIVFGTNLRF